MNGVRFNGVRMNGLATKGVATETPIAPLVNRVTLANGAVVAIR